LQNRLHQLADLTAPICDFLVLHGRLNNQPAARRSFAIPARIRFFSVAVALAGATLLAGCDSGYSLRDEANSSSAGDKGNCAMQTSDSEKAYADHPDVLNEFNLATGYENTGQDVKAAALYQDLIVKGQFTQMQPNSNDNGSPVTNSDTNVADESARRIQLMEGHPSAINDHPEMSR
jgi:hypothetical protein